MSSSLVSVSGSASGEQSVTASNKSESWSASSKASAPATAGAADKPATKVGGGASGGVSNEPLKAATKGAAESNRGSRTCSSQVLGLPVKAWIGIGVALTFTLVIGAVVLALAARGLVFQRFHSCDHMSRSVYEPGENEPWFGFWSPWYNGCEGVTCAGCRSNDWNATNNYYVSYADGRVAAVAEDAGGGEEVAPVDFGTNNQVSAVDEADIVKRDATHVYAIVNNRTRSNDWDTETYCTKVLQIVDAASGAIVSSTALSFRAREMFITGTGRLVVMGQLAWGPDLTERVHVQIFDVTDRASPTLVRGFVAEGQYLQARLIGTVVYMVSSYHMYSPSGPVPSYAAVLADDGALSNPQPVSACTDIGYFTGVSLSELVTVWAVDVSAGGDGNPPTRESVALPSAIVYASVNNIFVAAATYGSWSEQTVVGQFAIDGTDVAFVQSFDFAGTLLNQFSMDEHEGHLRVAITRGREWSNDWSVSTPSTNEIRVFNLASGDETGAVTGLAEDERIESARFMGARGFIVTFRQIDPLFTIDLSDPTNPTVLGELKIPGFSEYLHPLTETELIGVGRDGDDAGILGGVKISLFDVSDLAAPVEAFTVAVGERGSMTLVADDHKAFRALDANTITLPITETVVEPHPEWGYQREKAVFNGAYVFEVDRDAGAFVEAARLTHMDLSYQGANPNASPWTWRGYGTSVARTLTSDAAPGMLLVVSNDVLSAVNMTSWEEVWRTQLSNGQWELGVDYD